MTCPQLRADPARLGKRHDDTGIYVRAEYPNGGFGTINIAELDLPSLRLWLRSRGGENQWAEDVVVHLLGHSTEESTA